MNAAEHVKGSFGAIQDSTGVPATSAAAVGFGIRSSQEPKYGINAAGRLVNRSTGIEIPDDEPVMVFRAKDSKAIYALHAYYQACESPDHRAVIKSRISDFKQFILQHPDRMREPTSNLRELAGANVGRELDAPQPKGQGVTEGIGIAMQPVKSSNVSAIGYHDSTQTLAVTFASGGTYHYAQVPRETFNQLLASDSKGAFIATHVRGKYTSQRLPSA